MLSPTSANPRTSRDFGFTTDEAGGPVSSSEMMLRQKVSLLNNKMDITVLKELLASGFSSTATGILRAGIGVGIIVLGGEEQNKVWESINVPWNAPAGRKILQIDYNLGQNGSSKNSKEGEQTVRKLEKHLLIHRSGSLQGIPPYMNEEKCDSVTAEAVKQEYPSIKQKFQLGCGKPATVNCGYFINILGAINTFRLLLMV